MTKIKLIGTAYIIVLLIISINVNSTYTPDTNTVTLWHFDEGSGTMIFDSTPNNNFGDILGGATWTNGIFGSALEFDGLDDRISIPKTPSMDLTQQVSIEAWIKRKGNQDGTIFSRNGPFYIAVKNNKIFGGIHTSGGAEGWTFIEGTSDLQLDQWYHVALTYDGFNIRGYVNGILEDAEPKSGIMVIRSQQPWIGWGEPGQDQFFRGIIDEVRISNIARTSFDLNTTPPEPAINLTEVINNLTNQVSNLQNQVQQQEQRISLLENTVNILNTALSSLQNIVDNIFTNLFGLPRGLRQEMVCSAMKATNQTSATGFGLTCTINDKGACSCS